MKEMGGAKDIVGISVPFVAGIAAGIAIGARIAAASFLPVLFICSALILLKSRTLPSAMTFFLLCGLLCGIEASLSSVSGSISLHSPHAILIAEKVRAKIDSIPYPSQETSGIVKALLTGDRSGLSKETVRIFRASGASHILALSGMHLGIIYAILLRLSVFLGHSPRGNMARYLCIMTISVIYVLATGAGASIMRAFLFILIRETALLFHRKTDPVRTYCGALMVQLAFDPTKIGSVSFQLSYLAMAGIILVFPVLKGWYPSEGKLDPVKKIWDTLALSLSCQLFTGPLAWLRFGTFPKYFLLTNMLALPLTTAVMVISVATVGLSMIKQCPDILIVLDDKAVGALSYVLKIISSM